MGMVGVSSGTAAVLGLSQNRNDTLPTTAYLLLGESCRNSCSFCPRGAHNDGGSRYLSRVTWPLYSWEEVFPRLIFACREGLLGRVCFQVTDAPGNHKQLLAYGRSLAEEGVAVNTSCVIHGEKEGRELLDAGFARIALALDAASPDIYARVKGDRWQKTWELLSRLNTDYPGQVGTHLIAGLGEQPQEMFTVLFKLIREKIGVGLFAFTPVRGTPLAGYSPPPLNYYRQLQLASQLFQSGEIELQNLSFQGNQLRDWGLSPLELARAIRPQHFQTPGCLHCNRPYYNERPGGTIYNYPRPLTPAEFVQATREALIGTEQEGVLDEKQILATYC